MKNISESRRHELESYIKCIMDAYKAVGLAVSVIDDNCDILYEKYFGCRDMATGKEIDENTIFGIASLTKSFTCLSVMQLEQKGLLDTEEPVVLYLPEYQNAGQDVVKIKHFMSHCAGYYPLPRIKISDVAKTVGADEAVCDYAYDKRIFKKGEELVIERLNTRKKLLGKPGEYSSYCNDGYGVLAALIGRYGLENSYVEYVKKHIFQPLGMNRSTFEFNILKTDGNVSKLYEVQNGMPSEVDDIYNYHFVLPGGGGIKSTIKDMRKYVCMYLNNGKNADGEEILDSFHVKEMCKPRILFRPQIYYGYGLYTEMLDNIETVRHYGSLPGVSSTMIWSYELGIGAIVLCNTTSVPVENIARAIIRAFNGYSPECGISEYRDMPEAVKDEEIVGRYVAGEGPIIEIYMRDKLMINIGGEDYPLHIVQNNLGVIYEPFMSVPIMLIRDDGGKIFAVKYIDRIIPKIMEGAAE